MRSLILALATISVSACAPRVEYVTPHVALPSPLILPKVSDPSALECLDEETYQTLKLRDKLQTNRRLLYRQLLLNLNGASK